MNLATDLKNTPLHQVARSGNAPLAKLLISANAKLDMVNEFIFYRNGAPLHFAAEYGNDDVVQTFIEAGANLNIKDGMERTPMRIAAKYENQKL